MNNRHRELHALLASLGHSSRFRIALRLLEGERCVGELAQAIGLSQSCTTRHVQALERAGIVHSHRDGKRVLVGLERERSGLDRLIDWLGPTGDAGPAWAATVPKERGGATAARRGPRAKRATTVAREGTRRADRDVPSRALAAEAPELPAVAPSVAAKEEPHREAPPSGTHPDPTDTPAPPRRHLTDPIEDFLL